MKKMGLNSKQKNWRIISLFLILLFSIGLVSCSKDSSSVLKNTQSKGYKSSEEAIRAYFDAMKKQDLEGMMNTFAIEEYIENYNFTAYLERIRSYSMTVQTPPLPNIDEYTKNINIESYRSMISRDIYMQYYCLADPEKIIDPSYPVKLEGEEDVVEFVSELENRLKSVNFASLDIQSIDTPENYVPLYNTESNLGHTQYRVEIAGAEKIENYIVFATLDDIPVVFCIETIAYNGRWYMHSLGGNAATLLGIDAYSVGTMYNVSQDELAKNK